MKLRVNAMKIEDANKKIAAILDEVESSNNACVDSVEILVIEKTAMGDKYPSFMKRVSINLKRFGGDWDTGHEMHG